MPDDQPWDILAGDDQAAISDKHVHRCPNCGFFFECLELECKDDYSSCCGDCE